MVDVKKLLLHEDQYYHSREKKTHIFLHHTAGGSALSTIQWWNQTKDRVGTAFIIERDGTIYQVFESWQWAYALGVKGATDLEKASIQIEICSWGGLTIKDNKYFNYAGKEVRPENVVHAEGEYRGSKHFESYTGLQIVSLGNLLKHLKLEYSINIRPIPKFWEYRDWKTLLPGVWSHTTVRKDKQDIFPQAQLVDMLYHL